MTLYVYRAEIVEIHDGDTLTADVDLGFRVWHNAAHLRLAGVSARELSMPGGPEAREHLVGLLPPQSMVTIRSFKADKDPADDMSFDRYVAVVTLPDGRDLAELLVQAGWAAPWNGRARPIPYPAWPIVSDSNA